MLNERRESRDLHSSITAPQFHAEHAERAEERHAENRSQGEFMIRARLLCVPSDDVFWLRGEVSAPEQHILGASRGEPDA